MPRLRHKPTEQSKTLVRRLSGLGVVVDDIARLTELNDNTVRKYYREDIAKGRAEANLQVARSLFHAATRPNNPNIVACMFWLKNRAGWKDLAAAARADGDGVQALRIEFVNPDAVGGDANMVASVTINGSAEHAAPSTAPDTFTVAFGPEEET